MDRTDLNKSEWLTHLQEELMDATLYIEKLKEWKKTLRCFRNESKIFNLTCSQLRSVVITKETCV